MPEHMGFWKEKKQWLGHHWKSLLAVLLIGLLPFLPFFLSGGALYASDALGAPAWKFYFDALRQGTIPMWLPYSFGGMPTFDAGFGDGSYPLFLLLGALLPIKVFISYAFITHVLIAGFTSYLLVSRWFGLGRVLSTALAVAYMLNTNFISHIHSGHTGKFFIMAWLPLSLYLLLRNLSSRGKWYHAGLFALSISLLLSTFHPQFTYYVLMGFFLVWAFKCYLVVRESGIPAALGLALRFWLPIFCGIGMVFFLFYPPMQYTKHYGIRGSNEKTTYEHATSWSMHPEEAASLLVPEFGGINENYWGRNPFKLNSEYPGLSVLFLGIMGFAFFFRDKRRWFWLWGGVGLMAVIFGLGAHTPLFRLFYSLVPGIKNFRAPSMMLFWLAVALLMMSADALSRLSNPASIPADRKKAWGKRLWQAGFAVAGVFVLAGIAPDVFFGIWDALFGAEGASNLANRVQNKSAFALGAIRAGALLAVLVYAARKWLLDETEPLRFGAVLLAVTALDLMWVNSNFIKVYDPNRMLPNQPAIEFLKADTTSQRVFGIPGAYERWVMQYSLIETADGWTDNEYRLYREYRGGDYMNNPNLMAGLKQNADGSVSGSPFLDMLNVKFLAYRLQGDGTLRLAPNHSALPRAWFVPGWRTESDTVAIERMKEPGFNPRNLAYVSRTTPLPEGFAAEQHAPAPGPQASLTGSTQADTTGITGTAADSTAHAQAGLAVPAVIPAAAVPAAAITRTEDGYNRKAYKIETAQAGILVISDLWFPHWRLAVDGKPAPLLRTDFAFQGAALSPGTHEVAITYDSPWIKKGFAVAGLSLLVLAAGLFGIARFGRPGGRKDVTPA